MVLKCVEKIEPFFKRRHKAIVALTVHAPVSKQEPGFPGGNKESPSRRRTGHDAGLAMQTIFEQVTGRINGALVWPARMTAAIRKVMEVPFGYQDEAGFHLGVEPILQLSNPSPNLSHSLRPGCSATDGGRILTNSFLSRH
jgi:hypothetical protein